MPLCLSIQPYCVTGSYSSRRFCNWKATRSYVEYLGKKFDDGRNPPKSVYKYPPWSGGKSTLGPQPHLPSQRYVKREQRSEELTLRLSGHKKDGGYCNGHHLNLAFREIRVLVLRCVILATRSAIQSKLNSFWDPAGHAELLAVVTSLAPVQEAPIQLSSPWKRSTYFIKWENSWKLDTWW